MARSHTVFFLLSGLAGLLGVSALLFVVDEMRLVMRETTLDNVTLTTLHSLALRPSPVCSTPGAPTSDRPRPTDGRCSIYAISL